MKTLFICRHAKSDWSTSLPDHDRPLNQRGKQNAPMMADVWRSLSDIPDLWVSSSAKRAHRTAQLMKKRLGTGTEIYVEPALYHAGRRTWLEVINRLDDEQSSAVLFGHNPGITDIVNYLSGSDIANIPTCGLARIDFPSDAWAEISYDTGNLAWFEYPRKYM